jgi:hypothetical protein
MGQCNDLPALQVWMSCVVYKQMKTCVDFYKQMKTCVDCYSFPRDSGFNSSWNAHKKGYEQKASRAHNTDLPDYYVIVGTCMTVVIEQLAYKIKNSSGYRSTDLQLPRTGFPLPIQHLHYTQSCKGKGPNQVRFQWEHHTEQISKATQPARSGEKKVWVE